MSKIPRTSVQGLIKPAQSHSHMDEQVPEQAAEQLRDADVPIVPPETETETETVAARPATRARRAKAKSAPEPELKDYAHRSLYAKPETLDLIREIAFKERISAQALYREGLFLMLRKRGHYKDKHIDDV